MRSLKYKLVLTLVALVGSLAFIAPITYGLANAEESCTGHCTVVCNDKYTKDYDSVRDTTDAHSICASHRGVKTATMTAAETGEDTGGGSDPGTATLNTGDSDGKYSCGGGDSAVKTTINIGCKGQGNPIVDMAFAIIRLLSDGIGLLVIGSLIVAGIQYSASAGDPQAAAKALGRVRATIIALVLYIFAYPLLNYLIPAGFFK